MWKTFFTICDLLCGLIPNAAVRKRIRANQLFDWRKKLNALRDAFPNLNFRHTTMIKGGWNIGFVVDNKYVFKIRKKYTHGMPPAKILREKRITDAFSKISPIQIPKIDVVQIENYTFYRYNFIPGKNLNKCRVSKIIKHRQQLSYQLARFINAVHNSRPIEIEDLRNATGDGWNHNDICNNIIIDPKTMKITGVIDWEYASWGTLENEFINCTRFSQHMRDAGLDVAIRSEYAKIKAK